MIDRFWAFRCSHFPGKSSETGFKTSKCLGFRWGSLRWLFVCWKRCVFFRSWCLGRRILSWNGPCDDGTKFRQPSVFKSRPNDCHMWVPRHAVRTCVIQARMLEEWHQPVWHMINSIGLSCKLLVPVWLFLKEPSDLNSKRRYSLLEPN